MEELANKLEEYEIVIHKLQDEIDFKNESLQIKSKENNEILLIMNDLEKEIENLNEYILKLTDEKNNEKEKSQQEQNSRKKKYENEILILQDQIVQKEELEKTLIKDNEELKSKNQNLLIEMDLKIKKFVNIEQYDKKIKEIEKLMKERENLINTISLKDSKIKSLDSNLMTIKEKYER